MKRMCCERLPSGERCDLVLGWVVCVAEVAGQITSGVCDLCADRALLRAADELAAEFNDRPRALFP